MFFDGGLLGIGNVCLKGLMCWGRMKAHRYRQYADLIPRWGHARDWSR
jgi:hypothetical protein